MSLRQIETIGVVGAGLIGGSLVGLINAHAAHCTVHVLDVNEANYDTLKQRGMQFNIVSSVGDFGACDLVFVSVPPGLTGSVVVALLAATTTALIVDMASIKLTVQAEVLSNSAQAARFIGGHPLAGGNLQGPAEASAQALAHSQFILSPHALNDPDDIARAEEFLKELTFTTLQIEAAAHDDLLAQTSHLPHLISYGYANAIAQLQKNPPHGADLDCDVFSRSTRSISEFASENIDMWADIFTANGPAVSRALDGYILSLLELRATLRHGADGGIKDKLREAHEMSRQIKRTKLND